MAEIPAPGVVQRGHPLLRRGSGWALVGAVSIVHLLAVNQVANETLGWGERERDAPRIEVAFVRELQQAAPPVVAPAPAAPPKPDRTLPLVAQRPKDAASAPAAVASAAAEAAPAEPVVAAVPAPPPPEPAAPAPELPPAVLPEPPPLVAAADPAPAASVASAAPATAPVAPPAPVSASASPAPTFDWPPSTRLSYLLQGDINGPVDGTAVVEWLRSGQRYQVRFEVTAATFFSRRSVSDGELTAHGLEPKQFQGEQRAMFKTRRWSQQFHPERITLSDGPEQPTAPGVQDEASQFVQLTWLFTTQPQLLQVGQRIEVPLALPTNVDRWAYDVVEKVMQDTPFGPVETFHLRPRRELRPNRDLVADVWFAPTLQYLPVRLLIRQDEATYIDLMIDRLPQQEAAASAPR
jgi:hypothetical protein